MTGRLVAALASIFALLSAAPVVALAEEPEKVAVCALKADPAAYNHRLIEVTGFVSHGFEDFSLFDPECLPWMGVWLEYGGTVKSGTMYCCGPTAGRSRRKPLIVEKIPIPLVRDDTFERFDNLIQRHRSVVLHATLVGRFFAGQRVAGENGQSWEGYGHMGCCSLLAVQQVRVVNPVNRNDVDYDPYPHQPKIDGVGCWVRELTDLLAMDKWITAQREAEDRRPWSFDDPHRVAIEALARFAGTTAAAGVRPKESHPAQGRIVYEWAAMAGGSTYTVVVSRPDLVSYYANDPARIAWIAVAVYESSCEPRQ